MFPCLLAKLVSAQVISLVVSCGCGLMGVGGKIVQLCGSSVCALWHGGLLYVRSVVASAAAEGRVRQAANALAGQAYTEIIFLTAQP
jgi:hypothetical protein